MLLVSVAPWKERFQNARKICLWNSESGKYFLWNPESWPLEVEYSSRNPYLTDDKNPEFSTWNPESTAWNLESIHLITTEHIALNYYFPSTCEFAFMILLKGALMVKSIIFRWFPPFYLNISRFHSIQKMTPLSYSPKFNNYFWIFGWFFECFYCIKFRRRSGEMFKILGKWENFGFRGC